MVHRRRICRVKVIVICTGDIIFVVSIFLVDVVLIIYIVFVAILPLSFIHLLQLELRIIVLAREFFYNREIGMIFFSRGSLKGLLT
jgi:hypothetical protein